jgi:hypothetical protein
MIKGHTHKKGHQSHIYTHTLYTHPCIQGCVDSCKHLLQIHAVSQCRKSGNLKNPGNKTTKYNNKGDNTIGLYTFYLFVQQKIRMDHLLENIQKYFPTFSF